MIWENDHTVHLPKLKLSPRQNWGQWGIDHREWDYKVCRYCDSHLRMYDTIQTGQHAYFFLMVCNNCGWWVIKNSNKIYGYYGSGFGEYSLLYSSIKDIDVNSTVVDIDDINQYLIVDYEKRYQFKPRIFEEYIASLFTNMGYEVEITPFSNDKGIDLFIITTNFGTIGIQVKRYRKKKIEAENIRSFAGAMVLNGVTNGIFVTTSGFRSGADDTVKKFRDRGIFIDLWDAKKLLETIQAMSRITYGIGKDNPFDELWSTIKRQQISTIPLNLVSRYEYPTQVY